MLGAARAAVTGAVGASLWTPDDLGSDLILWHDTQRQSGYSEGDPVTQWDAQAGAGHLVSAGTTDPVWRAAGINGRPAIEIDTDDQHMDVDSIFGESIAQPFTVAVVAQLDDTASAHVLWGGGGDSGAAPNITYVTGGAGLRIIAGDTAIESTASGGGVPFLLIAVYDGEGSALIVNGVRTPTVPTLIDAGDLGFTTNSFFLGASSGTWGGLVGELVAVDSNLEGTSELTRLSNYMTTRWGL